MKNYEFVAKLTGDCECFCFEFSKEQFIKTFGIEEYNKKINFIKESNEYWKSEYPGDPEMQRLENEDPQSFMVYPTDLFGYEHKITDDFKISISFEKIK